MRFKFSLQHGMSILGRVIIESAKRTGQVKKFIKSVSVKSYFQYFCLTYRILELCNLVYMEFYKGINNI